MTVGDEKGLAHKKVILTDGKLRVESALLQAYDKREKAREKAADTWIRRWGRNTQGVKPT